MLPEITERSGLSIDTHLLGRSLSAYEEACDVMGQEVATIAGKRFFVMHRLNLPMSALEEQFRQVSGRPAIAKRPFQTSAASGARRATRSK